MYTRKFLRLRRCDWPESNISPIFVWGYKYKKYVCVHTCIYAFKENSSTIYIGVRHHRPVRLTIHGCTTERVWLCTWSVSAHAEAMPDDTEFFRGTQNLSAPSNPHYLWVHLEFQESSACLL